MNLNILNTVFNRMKYSIILYFLLSCNSFVDPATKERIWIKDVEEDKTASLKGTDFDNDGIRDDVQKWIDLNIKDPNLILGLKQFTRYKTQGMLAYHDKVASRLAQNAALDALDCLVAIGFEIEDIYALASKVDSVNFNTEARSRSNKLSEIQMSGSERIAGDKKLNIEKCEFKIIRGD